MTRRFCTMLVVIMVGLMLASTVSAQRRVARKGNAAEKKIALSVSLGAALPNGDFSDIDLGNHESGGQFNVEGEYYFSRTVSLGLTVQGSSFDDKTFPEITTSVLTTGAYVRYVAETGSKIRPFFRFGVALTQLEFEGPALSVESESKGGFLTGVGFIALVSPRVSVNGELGYKFANTEETEIKGLPGVVVGFKTSYVTITGGVSFYIPM